MRDYLPVILSGLFWIAGPTWADDWCAALGDMARATAVARDAGVPMEACLRNVATVETSDAVRGALRVQVYAAYRGRETPEQARDRAVRVCREAEAQVDADLARREHR